MPARLIGIYHTIKLKFSFSFKFGIYKLLTINSSICKPTHCRKNSSYMFFLYFWILLLAFYNIFSYFSFAPIISRQKRDFKLNCKYIPIFNTILNKFFYIIPKFFYIFSIYIRKTFSNNIWNV